MKEHLIPAPPFARAAPQAHRSLLAFLLGGYRRAIQTAGQAPDADLVRQAEAVLHTTADQASPDDATT